MKNKKVVKALLLGMCLFVIILVAFAYFKPRALISLPYTVSNDNTRNSKIDISISTISYNGENITDKVDKVALVDILSMFSYQRTLSKPTSYLSKDAWEISLVQGNEPLYIVLGETAFCYSSSNSIRCRVLDSEALKQALESKSRKRMERFKAAEEELSTQDFELAYELGEMFLKDYYAYKAGESEIDFTLYIVNENLLKYSNKRVADESYTMDIKEASVGLSQARFMPEEKCFNISYATVMRDNNIGGFSEVVEVLISAADGRLVISDWYIAHGAGSSSFDQVHRNNARIDSPDIWDNQEYVKSIFEAAGIKQ